MPSRRSILFSLMAMCFVITPILFQRERRNYAATRQTGTLILEITNPECRGVSANESAPPNAPQTVLNDGRLDPIEIRAIASGCTIQATAISPNGTRLTDIPLLLLRTDAGGSSLDTFGGPRRTDAYGQARWAFPLTPNTDLIYFAITPNPLKSSAVSNQVEIQLCTGRQGAQVASSPEIGLGCP
jgi:hypothetical protein